MSARRRVLSLAIPVLLLAGAACLLPTASTTRFIIPVDSIIVPQSIVSTDTLFVRFRGLLGPDQCSGLERVEKWLSMTLLEIRFHGKRQTGGNDCLQMPSTLDYEVKIPPSLGDPFTIRVLRGDGTSLEKQVRIR